MSDEVKHKISGSHVLFLIIIFFSVFGCAGKKNRVDFFQNSSSDNTSEISSPYLFFWSLVSAADGDRCQMSPSCSAYSAESIKKYGFIEGYLMTCDRLLRCGRDEVRLSPRIKIQDDFLCLDPPHENKIR